MFHHKLWLLSTLLCLTGLLVSSAAPVYQAQLIADINPTNEGSNVAYLSAVNGHLFLTTDDQSGEAFGNGQRSYWMTGGTPETTTLLASPNSHPSPCCSFMFAPEFFWFKNRYYFAAYDTPHGTELWTSDGTPQGTQLFIDIEPGTSGASIGHFTVVGDWLYFTRSSYAYGSLFKLMRTNGEPGVVEDVGSFYTYSNDLSLAALQGELLFNGCEYTCSSSVLWATRGTPETTRKLADPSGLVFGYVNHLTPGKGPDGADWVYFAATDPQHGQELWRTDGTPQGTHMVKDFLPGSGSSFDGEMIWANGALYLVMDEVGQGAALWRTDGSEAGFTRLLVGGGDLLSGIGAFTMLDGRVYFVTVSDFEFAIWRTDGTPAGTLPVTRFSRQEYPVVPSSLTASGSCLFFVTRDSTSLSPPDYESRLWGIDQNDVVTELKVFKDCAQFSIRNPEINLRYLTDVNGQLYFAACDRLHGDELWTSDGTPQGTRLAIDFDQDGIGAGINAIAQMNGQIYFQADDDSHGLGGHTYQLWVAGSTPGSARPLLTKTGARISASSSVTYAADGYILFVGSAVDRSEYGLFRSDGTPAGTQSILSEPVQEPVIYKAYQGSILIFDDYRTQNIFYSKIWKTDGRPEGTEFITRLPDGARVLNRSDCELNGMLYFVVSRGFFQSEIWQTDGTEPGTRVAVSLPGSFGWSDQIKPAGELMFFFLQTQSEVQLWQSDGTQAGTQLVTTVANRSSDYDFLINSMRTALDDTLIFLRKTPEGDYQLMKTRGAASGVEKIHHFGPLEYSELPRTFVTFNGRAYFCAGAGEEGNRLWRTDGSAGGTYPLLPAGSPYQGCTGPYVRGERLFFQASAPETGTELWTSLGTPETTYLLADIEAGPVGSSPSVAGMEGDILWLTANVPQYGTELWVLDLDLKRLFLPLVGR